MPPGWQANNATDSKLVVNIPGPLRSFGRMAAISSDIQPEDVLPALARNVVTNGYQASHSNEALEQTEYLKLVHRYLSQARELEKLAGAGKVIKIDTCESPQAGDLLRILGYRMRGGCGSEVVLETVNATRAFLTTDSGFPLPELEQALRTNRPFTYDYHPTRVPVLYGADYWLLGKREGRRIHRRFPGRARHVPPLSGTLQARPRDRRGAAQSDSDAAPASLRARAGFLRRACSRSAAARPWCRAVRAPSPPGPNWPASLPIKGAAFFERLIARDDGWMASYTMPSRASTARPGLPDRAGPDEALL